MSDMLLCCRVKLWVFGGLFPTSSILTVRDRDGPTYCSRRMVSNVEFFRQNYTMVLLTRCLLRKAALTASRKRFGLQKYCQIVDQLRWNMIHAHIHRYTTNNELDNVGQPKSGRCSEPEQIGFRPISASFFFFTSIL